MKSQKFYQSLGKLFYAIASVDKVVRKDEVEILKSLVKEKWLDLDDVEDEFGTDAAYQIEIVFDWLLDQEAGSASTFRDFQEFFKNQPNLFSPKAKKMILETSESIAAAFSGKNKDEEQFLNDLKSLLK